MEITKVETEINYRELLKYFLNKKFAHYKINKNQEGFDSPLILKEDSVGKDIKEEFIYYKKNLSHQEKIKIIKDIIESILKDIDRSKFLKQSLLSYQYGSNEQDLSKVIFLDILICYLKRKYKLNLKLSKKQKERVIYIERIEELREILINLKNEINSNIKQHS